MAPEPLVPADLAALSIFPLPDATLFPGAPLPLHVFEPRYRALVRDALAGSKVLAVARLKPGFENDYDGRPPVFEICGAGRIVEHVELADGRYHVMLRGIARVRILHELPPAQAYRVVRAEVVADEPAEASVSSALEREIAQLWRLLAPKLPEGVRDLAEVTRGAPDAGNFADRVAALLASDASTSQALLAEPDPCERLRLIVERLHAAAESLGLLAEAKRRSN
ncbi:MAG TPA: LON peptidase substrate-binding domain-containing protein [Polyangiaceae bacterium]|nr:LON peptidase substrate-binding domain-containing protein [Polyangiaceae bacterium]